METDSGRGILSPEDIEMPDVSAQNAGQTEPDGGPEVWFAKQTISKIVSTVHQHAQIRPADKRTKQKLFAAIESLAEDKRDLIRASAALLERPGRKRKREDAGGTASKRQKLPVPVEPDLFVEMEQVEDVEESVLDGAFLRAPTQETIEGCMERSARR